MRKNTDQENSEYGHFSRMLPSRDFVSCILGMILNMLTFNILLPQLHQQKKHKPQKTQKNVFHNFPGAQQISKLRAWPNSFFVILSSIPLRLCNIDTERKKNWRFIETFYFLYNIKFFKIFSWYNPIYTFLVAFYQFIGVNDISWPFFIRRFSSYKITLLKQK